jgi:hypothetical protein
VFPAIVRRVIKKTADYKLESRRDRSGTVFTNRGATGAVTFTLPPASRCEGFEYLFLIHAAQTVTIASAVADTLVGFNDVDLDSVAYSTGSKQVGVCARAICDGVSWFVHTVSADGVTGSIATLTD